MTTPKLCKDCRHIFIPKGSKTIEHDTALCAKGFAPPVSELIGPRSPVTGEWFHMSAVIMRYGGQCGEEAKLFERKP